MSEVETQVERDRLLIKQAIRLASLAKVDAFRFLQAEIEKKRERIKTSITGRLLAGEGMVTLQRQIDYDRGFIDGMLYPAQVVEAAAKKMAGADASEEPATEVMVDGWPGYGAADADRSAD